MIGYLRTGQTGCYDRIGRPILCRGSGQDGELRKGMPWPIPRIAPRGVLVEDRLTGLVWSRNANPAEFPLTWQEALDFVAARNREGWLGHSDWRLPNRRELRSLLSFQARRLALPQEHPFDGVFPSWYWTSTSVVSAPNHAWYVNLDGARTFLGGKDQSFFLWPVRGQSGVLERAGQVDCCDGGGLPRPCQGAAQDGELRAGRRWPETRLIATDAGLKDQATDLVWHLDSDAGAGPVNWSEAFAVVASLGGDWRLPNINELESLVDCGRCAPALAQGSPSSGIRQGYWSSTTSLFEPDWAWALYTENGGIGVGQKGGRHFHVWAVRDGSG